MPARVPRPAPRPIIPPSDEELASLRGDLRRNAEIFSRTATMAADGGALQRALRDLGGVMDRIADGLTLDGLDSSNYDTRRDVVALSLLTMTVAAGTRNYGSVARTIQAIMSDTTEIGD
jgi:hypothetical protein